MKKIVCCIPTTVKFSYMHQPYAFRSGNCTRKAVLPTSWTRVSWNSSATRFSVPSASASSASRAHLGSGHPCQRWCPCSQKTSKCQRQSRSPATSPSGRRARARGRWPGGHVGIVVPELPHRGRPVMMVNDHQIQISFCQATDYIIWCVHFEDGVIVLSVLN